MDQETKQRQRALEAPAEFGAARNFKGQGVVADRALGAAEPLRDGSLVGEEGARDLPHAEAADGLEAQRYAGIAREVGMAAHDDHSQLVVAKLLFEGRVVGWDYRGSRQLGYDRFRFVAQKLPA